MHQSKHRVCACKDCNSPAERVGLCLHHYEKSLSARKKGTFYLWCHKNFVYLSDVLNSHNERIFRYSGRIIQDVCKCGATYERPEKGSRRLCPDCDSLRKKGKWTRQNIIRKHSRSIKNMLRNRGDADPNFKPFIHYGKPLTVTWYCEFSGCSEPYEMILLENRNRYYRFCPKHRGLI